MAWYFMLSVECSSERSVAETLARHFEGFTLNLNDAHHVTCSSSVSADRPGNWWAIITAQGINFGSPKGSDHTLTDTRHTSEIGWKLYERLKTAPPFRYGIVGWESEHFREYPELKSQPLDAVMSGMVMIESLALELGILEHFEPFATGFVWKPYQGEIWPPT